MRVAKAWFVAGAASPEQLPGESLPEVAFAGRSNVGKSSLLNRLVGRRGLARVGKTPGRTQQVNFFAVDGKLLFVDLPGYGFGNVPLAVRGRWRDLVEHYLTRRRLLCGVVVIVDVRRGLQEDDERLLAFLREHRRRVVLAVTKVDKVGRADRKEQVNRITAAHPELPVVLFSAVTGEGVGDLWRELQRLIGVGSGRCPKPPPSAST